MKILFILALINSIILTLASNQNRKSLIPLNFNEAIKSFHNKLELSKNIKKHDFDYINKYDIIDQINSVNSLNSPFPLPNVSIDCLSQLTLFASALSTRELWAIEGKNCCLKLNLNN